MLVGLMLRCEMFLGKDQPAAMGTNSACGREIGAETID